MGRRLGALWTAGKIMASVTDVKPEQERLTARVGAAFSRSRIMSGTSDRPHKAAARHLRLGARPQLQSDQDGLGRLFDVAGAFFCLIFFAPLLLLVAAVVAADRDGPILFRHVRVGRHGRPFTVYKFRTMTVDADARLAKLFETIPSARAEWAADHKLRHDPRITRWGRVLRRSSLDELPQIFNVLRGDMSLVGPRPIVAAEVEKYGRYFADYCRVKPGITGRWQVSGRNDVDYPRRVRMDAAYARRRTVALDIRILFATVGAVLSRRGSY